MEQLLTEKRRKEIYTHTNPELFYINLCDKLAQLPNDPSSVVTLKILHTLHQKILRNWNS